MTPDIHDAFADFAVSETLLVTIESVDDARRAGRDEIEALKRGESTDQPDTISFVDMQSLFETFNPLTIELLKAINAQNPESIRETARLVERDVKNVHTELSELARLGVIRFEKEGRGKRPVFPYDRLQFDVPFSSDEEEKEEHLAPDA